MKTNTRLRLTRTAAGLLAAVLLAAPSAAAGLRTSFGEVIVKGLKIGQTYSLHKLLNLPLRIVNTGEEPVDLRVDVIELKTEQVKAGYDVIPSTGWLRLEKQEFTSLEPQHEAVSDIIVSIPNDPSLLGRRFEAAIWSRTQSRMGVFAVGMQSRLLIHVDSTPPTEEELKAKFVDRKLANLGFTLHPAVGTVESLPVGREVNLKKEHKIGVKLINPNDEKLSFRIRSVGNWESLLSLPAGFEDGYNPQWLKPEREVVEIEGNSIVETALVMSIPDEERFRGKSLMFPVQVEILEQEVPARVFYKLLVTTEPPRSEKKD